MAGEFHREEIINSHARPFFGQKHRSSGNFSTRYIQDANGKQPKSLLWEIRSPKAEEINKISFQVYEDIPAGIDRKKFNGKRIYNGQRTEFIDERQIYIYMPQNATCSFSIRVTGMDTEPDK